MNNLKKIRLDGNIRTIPNYKEALHDNGWLFRAEFPKHIWISKEKVKGEIKHIINYYQDPQFDCPDLNRPDYWMPYEDEFDTPEGLLHQLTHMFGKNWFTAKMASEVMEAAQLLHKKIEGKDLYWWSYGERLKIYNKKGEEINE